MNRAQRRRMMKKVKKIPGYKNILKSSIKKTVDDFEEMMKKNWKNFDINGEDIQKAVNNLEKEFENWQEDDETLNNGEREFKENDIEDEIYNL